MFVVQEMAYTAQKVMGVIVGMKSHQVGAQKPTEDLFPPGQKPEDFEGRKWDMKEKADGRPGQPLAKQGGQEHQMVIMDPDLIAGPDDFEGFAAEFLIDPLVGGPVTLVVDGVSGKIMEQRPDRLVGEPMVIIINLGLAEKNGTTVLFFEKAANLSLLLQTDLLGGDAGPAEPNTRPSSIERTQAGGDPPRAALQVQPAPFSRQAKWQSIGDCDEFSHDRQ